jgi:hypothetical protein
MSLRKSHLLIPIALAALALGACGKKPADEQAAAQTDAAAEAQAKQDADIKQREEELNRREQELAMKEKEKDLANREAALAKASAPKPARGLRGGAVAAEAGACTGCCGGPENYHGPGGTSISVQLPAAVSTKTARSVIACRPT